MIKSEENHELEIKSRLVRMPSGAVARGRGRGGNEVRKMEYNDVLKETRTTFYLRPKIKELV
jgi:hypothetical protein